MARLILVVDYDPLLISPQFMADHILELEGVEVVQTEEGD